MKVIAVAHLARGAALLLLLAACTTRAEALDCKALLDQILSGGAMGGAWGNAKAQEYNRNCLGQPPRSSTGGSTEIGRPAPLNEAIRNPTYQSNPQPNAQSDPGTAWTNPKIDATVQALAKKVGEALAWLGAELQKQQNKAEMLPKGVPLSIPTVRQPTPTVRQPQPVPEPYDPFANFINNMPNPSSGASSAPAEATASAAPPSPQDILDSQVAYLRKNVTSMEMQPPPTADTSTKPADMRVGPCNTISGYCGTSSTFGGLTTFESGGTTYIQNPDGSIKPIR